MNTRFYLMGEFGARAVIPADLVRERYFSHLSLRKFQDKLESGEIALPLVRIEASQKAARGIHIDDLANWIDARREAAAKELKQMVE